jgi:hypothetical protein
MCTTISGPVDSFFFNSFVVISYFFFFSGMGGLNSVFHACKAAILPLATPLAHFALVILEMESQELFAKLSLNCDPPDPSLPSS